MGRSHGLLLYPLWLLFCYALAREILFDIHDAEGDRPQGVRTIANTWGRQSAFWVVWVLLAMMLISIPAAIMLISISHAVWFGGCVLLMLLNFGLAMALYQRQSSEKSYAQLVFWERLGMVVGAIGLLRATPPL